MLFLPLGMVSLMAKNKFITAYLMRVDTNGKKYRGYLSEVENSLKAEQNFVGGYIEVVRLTSEIDLIINDSGKLEGLRPNRLWRSPYYVENMCFYQYDMLCGNIMAVRHDTEGDFTSIHESDIEVINESLIPINEIIQLNKNTIFLSCSDSALEEWVGE